jgi:hypothetical protein
MLGTYLILGVHQVFCFADGRIEANPAAAFRDGETLASNTMTCQPAFHRVDSLLSWCEDLGNLGYQHVSNSLTV